MCGLTQQGITPILPIFREGILNGSAEVKESAAVGLMEVIRRTSSDALKMSVVNITGPLIRILGDRYGHGVKVAMLDTLTLLLNKVLCSTSNSTSTSSSSSSSRHRLVVYCTSNSTSTTQCIGKADAGAVWCNAEAVPTSTSDDIHKGSE